MDRKLRVLFLPKWYPNRYDPMPGLFICRQAEALIPFCEVAVIYVHPSPDGPEALEVDFSEENEVRVLRVYYRVKRNPSLPGKALELWDFYKAYMKAFHSIRAFSPDLVHAHILTRIGFIGWRIARKQNIPLVISEHWSRYFPGNNTYQGWLRKAITKFVIRKAAVLIAVSEPLRNAMLQCGLDHPRWRIIPNVVDTGMLTPFSGKHSEIKTMVHISCFEDRSKNISGFLRSLKELLSIRSDFTCMMIGAGPDWIELKEYADFLRLPGSVVQFIGLKTGSEFTELLSGACFSVVSSRYETFGTVVIESLACGVPVVSTAVGVAEEVINDTNGIIVPPGEETAMTDALNRMLDRCREYDKSRVRSSVSGRYSKEIVGGQLYSVYSELHG